MDNPLVRRLNPTTEEKNQLGKTLGRLKSVAYFFSDAVEAVKDTTLAAAVAKAAPWAGVAGESLAEVIPPVKFALKLFEGLTEQHEPDALGFLACTLAYQRAVEETIEEIESKGNAKKAGADVAGRLKRLEPPEETTFRKFSFKTALQHPFIRKADETLQEFMTAVGYGEEQFRHIQHGVHRRFVARLKSILSHGGLKEKFAPFTQLMELGTEEEQAYDALLEHAEYQRWLFEESPVFEKEPFALTHVYVDTDCGELEWGQIKSASQFGAQISEREAKAVDPFSERSAERQSLVETVMRLIGRKDFDDAVVIQGAAGSGKSTFTLKLCSELLKVGLRPIRIRLRDLQFDQHVSKVLPRALFPPDRERPLGPANTIRLDNVFLNNSIFDEQVDFRGASISPYVLILDGWDEISISANEGFQVRVVKMLEQIRSTYLSGRRVRVILTGRPSPAVAESMFLLNETPVLTVRPMSPEQLKKFVGVLHRALEARPVTLLEADGEQTVSRKADESWRISDPSLFDEVISRYETEFKATLGDNTDGKPAPDQTKSASSGSLEVLGLPLLAYLAIWLMSIWEGKITDLVSNPTTLYRHLVDLTCGKSGKLADDRIEVQSRISGSELRSLLWRTASAMTVSGKESISYTELSLRLGFRGYDLDRKASEAVKDHELTKLMISFFFKGGQTHLGAEFLHKSFREYLFAESVVESLKDYGRAQKTSPSRREVYWKDFAQAAVKDLRFSLSRELSKNLAPQWLSPEVADHLEQLVKWEIERATKDQEGKGKAKAGRKTKVIGTPTAQMSLKEWGRVRDGLADVWDWWAEGAHLRPPPKVADELTQTVSFGSPFVQELVTFTAPADASQRTLQTEPKRVITMDSHLGDGLFRLCALVHYHVAVNSGWLEPRADNGARPTPPQLWEGVSEPGKGARRCQTLVKQGKNKWVLFAPAGDEPRYFANYVSRINSAGWRPRGPFPLNVNLSGADLRRIAIIIPYIVPLGRTNWTHANLSLSYLLGSSFEGHIIEEVLAIEANFYKCYFYNASLDGSWLQKADCRFCTLSNTSLRGANLQDANLLGSRFFQINLKGVDLRGTDFSDSSFNYMDVSGVSFVDSVTTDIRLYEVIGEASLRQQAQGEEKAT